METPLPRSSAGVCPFAAPRHLFEDLAAARTSGGFPYAETFHAPVISRYGDLVEALHRPDVFSSSVTITSLPPEWRARFEGRIPTSGTLLGWDNPDHDRLREAVNSFFMPRRLERYAPWIRDQAQRLIDDIIERGQADLKADFGLPLPLKVISKIVGLDPDRSEWIGRALAFYQGDRDVNHTTTREEKAVLLFELHDYIRDVMEERRLLRQDDLISHVWNERDGGIEMTDMEMLSLFPGLMLAGHETSSNLICMATSHLLVDRDRWDWAQQSDDHRARALEELIRYESAITGMTRLVTQDTELGGIALKAGQRVFLAHASGSRDADVFDRADEIDFERDWDRPHLGFGQGIHACLGAPLARILLKIELAVLHERMPDLEVAVPYDELPYSVVSEGRGMTGLPVKWTPRAPRSSSAEIETRDFRGVVCIVEGIERVAEGVVELVLAAPDEIFPSWNAGAHIDLRLPNGVERQYSIVGSSDPHRIRVAVLREPLSRGSSSFIHDRLLVGEKVEVNGPLNHFALRTSDFALFVAGGIGITPILPMIREAITAGIGWRLLYLGHSLSGMAYAESLSREFGSNVYLWPSEDRGRFDLASITQRLPTSGTLIYACGPENLLGGLEDVAERDGWHDRLVMERFAPRSEIFRSNASFRVQLAKSGVEIEVPAARSVLDVVNEAGAHVLSTCREGTCGTCEVRVLSGTPEHRDSVLSARERLSNETMMTCVSRCLGDKLVLDL